MDNLAKPTGIFLKEHTENVLNEARVYIAAREFVFDKFKQIFNLKLEALLEPVCKYHDLGKKAKKWQDACQKEYAEFIRTGRINGRYLANAEIRHELYSVLICEQNNVSLSEEEKVSILAHHAKLSEKHCDKWEVWCNGVAKDLWKKCKKISNRSDKWNFTERILISYRFDGLRSMLQFADKRASATEANNLILPYTAYKYHFSNVWSKRPVQKIAEANAKDDLLLLRAPTGAGKTDAALLWAEQQINVLNRADRLVIALPTRFTSNALAINVGKSISETGVYHSTSKLHQSGLQNHFAKLLETPATVCTIDHLLIALSKTKEEHHQVYFNLANSCLVIDEADFYDEFTQANLLVLLEALRILKVPVLLMSASLPQSSLTLYQKAGYQINDIKEDTTDNDRPRCNVVRILEYESFEEINNLFDEATKIPSIIYVNTVDKAIKLKQWFTKVYPDVNVLLYHSRFTEKHKEIKEESLIKALGKTAWENDSATGIAILTQIGEMSVNISADYMISEICPIDRLVQRAGRLSRFKKEVGELIVLKPQKDAEFYPAPYGRFNAGIWEVNESLQATIEQLEEKTYSAKDFVELVNNIYKDGVFFSDKSVVNASKLRDMIKNNWLILPAFELEEEEEKGYWQTRDIKGQVIVIVLTPDEVPNFMNSYIDFEIFKNKYGIACPSYLVKKNLKEARLIECEIKVLDNKEKIFVLSSASMYSLDFGLDLFLPKEPDQFL